MTIVIGQMPSPCVNCAGKAAVVLLKDPWTIYLRFKDYYALEKIVAHELFHCIQIWNNNTVSALYYNKENGWFMEGTANWAADEAFDDISGQYAATKWERLAVPLNKPNPDGSSEYQTVGFWKWVEARRPDTIKDAIITQGLLTHDIQLPLSYKENLNLVKYLSTFLNTWPPGDANDGKLDFLQYAQDVEYWKNFDLDETNPRDLWSDPPYLGQAKDCQAEPDNIIRLARGEPGESKDNKLTKPYLLTQYLSMDTILVRVSDDSPVSGKLHVKFLSTVEPLDAVIIVHKGSDETAVQSFRDLSKLSEKDSEFISKFRSNYEAVIIIVDPRWQVDWQETPIDKKIEIWIEDPCPPNSGTVRTVKNTVELINALQTVGQGSTIRLKPGVYSPLPQPWDFPGNPGMMANLAVNGITLEGEDADQVIIIMDSNNAATGGLCTYGTVVLKNLT